jgi:SagB-type dehydrogenase family enzyme
MRLVSLLLITFVAPAIAMVNADGEKEMSIGQRFHHETSFGDSGFKGPQPRFGRQLPLYKIYEDVEKVDLPVSELTDLTVEQAIGARRSKRSFKKEPLSLPQLARLLLSADGITASSQGHAFRAAPSGGALYPIEIYVLVHDVTDLADGLFHFQVSDTSLELVQQGDFSAEIHRASHDQESVGSSPVTLILTARFERSTAKYADRGYRYTYLEAGAISENIYLQAISLGLGTVAVGAFNDDATNRLIGIDGVAEASLLIMPVGKTR